MLLDLAPDLHFKHYTVAEARLPSEALVNITNVPHEAVAVCADLDHHVFNPEHTDPTVAQALRETHWFDLREWIGAVTGNVDAIPPWAHPELPR